MSQKHDYAEASAGEDVRDDSLLTVIPISQLLDAPGQLDGKKLDSLAQSLQESAQQPRPASACMGS